MIQNIVNDHGKNSTPQWIEAARIAPHPRNLRVGRPEKVDVIAQSMRENGYRIGKPMLVRPHGNGYQAIGGHSRLTAAIEAGLDSVYCVIEEMDDDAAILRIAEDNLNDPPTWYEGCLYIFDNAEKASKKGLSRTALVKALTGKEGESASEDGRKKGNAGAVIRAILSEQTLNVQGLLEEDSAKTHHLAAIHALPASCWGVAVQQMLASTWSAKDTKHWVDHAKQFEIPDQWQKIFLPLPKVVSRYFATREFSPATVKRLINEAERVELMLASHDRKADEWHAWLSENAGEASWDIRKVSLHGREIENEIEADTSDCITWLQGEWQTHVGTLEDASVTAIITDPPYGVGYQSDYTLDRRDDRKHAPIANDADFDGAETQLRDSLTALYPKLKADAGVFVFCSWRNEFETRAAVEAAGLKIRNSLVWVKNRTGMGDPNTTFAPKHERIVFAVKGSPKLSERLPDVLDADRPDSSRHPTEKPTDLLAQLIGVVTAPGDLVVDPFGGVASTLVAAIESGRRAWGTELSMEYHAAGKERFQ